MRYLIFVSILFLCGCLSPHGVITGDLDTRTSAQKAGHNCEYSVIRLKNKSDYFQSLTIDSVEYMVGPARKFLFFRVAFRMDIKMYPGYYDIYDRHGDHIRLDVLSCMVYRKKFSKKEYVSALDDMFN